MSKTYRVSKNFYLNHKPSVFKAYTSNWFKTTLLLLSTLFIVSVISYSFTLNMVTILFLAVVTSLLIVGILINNYAIEQDKFNKGFKLSGYSAPVWTLTLENKLGEYNRSLLEGVVTKEEFSKMAPMFEDFDASINELIDNVEKAKQQAEYARKH